MLRLASFRGDVLFPRPGRSGPAELPTRATEENSPRCVLFEGAAAAAAEEEEEEETWIIHSCGFSKGELRRFSESASSLVTASATRLVKRAAVSRLQCFWGEEVSRVPEKKTL